MPCPNLQSHADGPATGLHAYVDGRRYDSVVVEVISGRMARTRRFHVDLQRRGWLVRQFLGVDPFLPTVGE